MDDMSSTESEGGESYDGIDTELQSTPAPPPADAAPPACSAGFNILDLQVALATQPPAPPSATAPEPDVFVIPRRPVAAAASAPSRPNAPSDEGNNRPCGHSMTAPTVALRQERFSCTCCKRKDLDAPNFLREQRQADKAETRKCRDCSYEVPSTPTKKKRKRVRKVPRIRAKHADRAPPQGPQQREQLPAAERTKMTLQEWRDRRGQHEVAPRSREEKEQDAPGQRKEMTWQERWAEKKRLYEQNHEPPPPRTPHAPRAALSAQDEWRQRPPPGEGDHAQCQQSQRPTPAEKKQRKRQKRMQEMAEIDRNPPPPRTSHPRREAAVRAQEEWRHQPQPDGSALLASRRRQEERGELLRRAQDASSRAGYSQHAPRSHFPSHR